jgi:DNA-binding MarR family transcriptional regulator
MTHPAQRLDNAVHQRTRLGILTVLAGADRVDFAYLRNALALTDGNLSRNLSVLEAAGFVLVDKTFDGRRTRTWISVTVAGRQALDAEIEALARCRAPAPPCPDRTSTTMRQPLARWLKNDIMSVIQAWTSLPAAEGLETIQITTRIAAVQPTIFEIKVPLFGQGPFGPYTSLASTIKTGLLAYF